MLNKKEVAKKLGVSETTIKRWMKDRKIPYYLLNGIVRFDEQKIDMWVERKSVRVKSVA
jgi:PTS system nitrogen regulatory IIA component